MLRGSRRSNIHPARIVSVRSLSSTGMGTHFMTYTHGKRVHQYPDIPHLIPPPIIPTYIRLNPPLRTTHPAAVLSNMWAAKGLVVDLISNDSCSIDRERMFGTS